ncbi:hypothetical protein K239x_34500 [Planctomycetes bacterium K23_9]|uniref:Uncharacterized protein n=1 Tax=Stieleria marina TaxID=1930275 RepID=A0A517NWF2_9BACT|nr:hypothetical protein K239x_34500 [Planctomycetes bacterium K23_9]
MQARSIGCGDFTRPSSRSGRLRLDAPVADAGCYGFIDRSGESKIKYTEVGRADLNRTSRQPTEMQQTEALSETWLRCVGVQQANATEQF